ncbi:aminotransferase class IV [Actinokineospora pegani]|uniref:aminotransferase class IV n=1 Tax=Actinokineospora pegani TaxID=2654637 RepID=UPI0012EA1E10|nr:aminotransferase class IV [Actinokineospora pegani]
MSTELSLPDHAAIPVSKLAYGHFTTMVVDNGRVRGLARHLERLDRDCWVLFGQGLPEDVVRAALRAALPEAGAVVARVTVVAPEIDIRRPEAPGEPKVLVDTAPLPETEAETETEPLKVRTAGYQRDLPQVKHVGTFGLHYQRRLARMAGFDDVLFATRDGQVSEGSTWNIGFLDREGAVVWPSAPALPGTAMGLIQSGLSRVGVPSRVRPVQADELPSFAAAFATSAVSPVRLIGSIDDVVYEPDPDLAARLRRAHDATAAERV